MSYETVIYEKDKEGIATITLNRPNMRNAVNPKLGIEVREAAKEAREDNDVRVLILTGAGTAFCSGFDIKEQFLAEERTERQRARAIEMLQDVKNLQKLGGWPFSLDFYKPTIAAVNGPAVGEGFAYSMACDIRIAVPTAFFSYRFVRMGLMQGHSGSFVLTHVVGLSRAMEMMMSGENIDAEEAVKLGIARMIVPADKLMEESKKMARKLMQGAPLAQQGIKQATYRALFNPVTYDDFWARLNRELYFTEDHIEGASAFMEKRDPVWKNR